MQVSTTSASYLVPRCSKISSKAAWENTVEFSTTILASTLYIDTPSFLKGYLLYAE